MARIILFVALTLFVTQSTTYAASCSSADAQPQKPCCQDDVLDWIIALGNDCINCHMRYFNAVYCTEPQSPLANSNAAGYINPYITILINSLNFEEDPRAFTLLRRALEKIPQARIPAETARFFCDAALNKRMSVDCLNLLKQYGADYTTKIYHDGKESFALALASQQENKRVKEYLLTHIFEIQGLFMQSTPLMKPPFYKPEVELPERIILWPEEGSLLDFSVQGQKVTLCFRNSDDDIIAQETFPPHVRFLLYKPEFSPYESDSEEESEDGSEDVSDFESTSSSSKETELSLTPQPRRSKRIHAQRQLQKEPKEPAAKR